MYKMPFCRKRHTWGLSRAHARELVRRTNVTSVLKSLLSWFVMRIATLPTILFWSLLVVKSPR